VRAFAKAERLDGVFRELMHLMMERFECLAMAKGSAGFWDKRIKN
jgi:hypothetical protein